MSSGPLITLDHIAKTFVVRVRAGRLRRTKRLVHAVDDVSFAITEGSMVGYIGPNGAGKSTTVKMLIGILTPSAGSVRVAGLAPSRARTEVARHIGVVFGQRTQLWWDLPLRDSFDLLRHVYGVPVERHSGNVTRYVDVLDLGAFLDTPVRQLSLGQRMRGELAAALLHDPEILFLDEPTIGLDLVSKEAVRGFLRELNQEHGTTVLLTTHDLVDVERLCERLLIIDHGHVIEDGSVNDIKARYGGERTLIVDLEEPSAPLEVDGAEVVQIDGPRQWLRFRRDGQLTAAQLVAAVSSLAAVRDIAIEETAIEDVVRRIYDGQEPQH
jgi:ABC-2 type transport system ATP-binding protein